MNYIFRIFGVIIIGLCIFHPLFSVGVTAQTQILDNGVAGFTECSFQQSKESKDSSNRVTACVRQILQFVFIVAIFLVVFRIALVGVYQFNPDQSIDAQKESVNLVRDLIIGFILIGGPGIFLGLLNANLIKLDFLDFQKNALTGGDASKAKAKVNNSVNGSGSGGSTNGGGGSTSTNATSVQGVSPTQLQQAVADLKANGANQQAADVVKKVATLNAQCKSPFVSSGISGDCKKLQTTEYQSILSSVTPSTLTGLGVANVENTTNFTGTFTSQYDMTVQQTSQPIKKGNCTTNLFSIKFNTPSGVRNEFASTTDCGTTPKDSSGLVINVDGNLNVQSTTIPSGTTFNRDITFLK